MVIEGREREKEGGDEEVRVEGEKRMEERRVGEGVGELRESVGDVEGGGRRVGEEVSEADEADSPSLPGFEDEAGSVPL